MLQIDLQCSYLIGATMAYVARDRLKTATPGYLAYARGVALAFAGAVFAPVWLYITLRWTPWETMYRADQHTLPLWLIAAYLPAMSGLFAGGFMWSARLFRGGHARVAWAIAGVLAASCVVILWRELDRVLFVGSLRDYHPGVPHNLWGSDLMKMMLLATVLVFVPAGLLTVHLLKVERV